MLPKYNYRGYIPKKKQCMLYNIYHIIMTMKHICLHIEIFFIQVIFHILRSVLPRLRSIRVKKKHAGAGNFFLGLVDPSRNRLASTAYFAKPGRLRCSNSSKKKSEKKSDGCI